MTERDYPERLTGSDDYYGVGADKSGETRMVMDEKMMGIVRHAMGTLGMYVVWMGWTDDATWITVSGAVMTFIPFVWSWMAKPAV